MIDSIGFSLAGKAVHYRQYLFLHYRLPYCLIIATADICIFFYPDNPVQHKLSVVALVQRQIILLKPLRQRRNDITIVNNIWEVQAL